jgi:hypothetical protein
LFPDDWGEIVVVTMSKYVDGGVWFGVHKTTVFVVKYLVLFFPFFSPSLLVHFFFSGSCVSAFSVDRIYHYSYYV